MVSCYLPQHELLRTIYHSVRCVGKVVIHYFHILQNKSLTPSEADGSGRRQRPFHRFNRDANHHVRLRASITFWRIPN